MFKENLHKNLEIYCFKKNYKKATTGYFEAT